MAVFLGLLLVWDLRLFGVMFTRLAVTEVWARLIPWITLGAVFMMATGVALFWAKPIYFWGHVFFRIKVAALFLALLNARPFTSGSNAGSSTGIWRRRRRVRHALPASSPWCCGP